MTTRAQTDELAFLESLSEGDTQELRAETLARSEGDRGRSAMELFDAGLITYDEMALLFQWTNETDDGKEILALAAGEFKISKEKMTNKGIDVTGVGEVMKGHSEWFKNLLGNVGSVAGNLMTAWSPAVAIGRGGWWAKDWVIDAWGSDMAGREKINAAIKEVEAVPADEMTESEKKALISELEGVPGGLGIWLEGEAEARIEEVFNDYPDLLKPESIDFGDMTPDEVRAYKMEFGGQTTGAFPGIQRQPEREVGPSVEGVGSFAEYLGETGLVEIEAQLPIDISAPATGLESIIPYDYGPDAFYDKSTNQAYTADEYQRILQGREMAALRYMPTSGTSLLPDNTVGGGGPLGEAFRESELGPNMADPDVRRAVETSQHVLPDYYGVQAKVASWFPDQPWEKEAYSWRPGSAISFINGMTAGEKANWKKQLKNQGMFNVRDAQGNTYFESSNQDFMLYQLTEEVLGVSRGEQISPWAAIPTLGNYIDNVHAQNAAQLAHLNALKAAAQPVKQPFSVPFSMRSVPSIKEIAQDVTDRFRIRVGRDPSLLERDRLAKQLTGYHKDRNRQMIDLAYAEWEGNNEIMDGADLEQVITNPSLVSSYDMEETWANEISLNKRRETNSDSFNRMLTATGAGQYGTSIASGNNVVGR